MFSHIRRSENGVRRNGMREEPIGKREVRNGREEERERLLKA
jgi:hypothetical protein